MAKVIGKKAQIHKNLSRYKPIRKGVNLINRNAGIDLAGPSVDAATDVGDILKAMVF